MMEENMSSSEETLIKPKTLEEVRAMIKSHKRKDFIFSLIGLLTIIFALLTLLILFVDLVMDGCQRDFSLSLLLSVHPRLKFAPVSVWLRWARYKYRANMMVLPDPVVCMMLNFLLSDETT